MSPVFRHGRLRLYLLKLLDEAPRHGYEIIRLLQDRFMGVYAPSPGTIYPRLARLEEEGLVTHDETDGRKVYRITEKGQGELHARLDDLAELEDEITASVRDIAREVTEDVRETVRTLREELSWAAREFHARAHQAAGADPGGPPRQASTDEARARAGAARAREAAAREPTARAPEQARDAGAQARQDAAETNAGTQRGREWGEWAGWTGWGGWPGAAGHHEWADPGAYRDLERLAKRFSRELRAAAWQAQAVSEDALRDLRGILDETIDRIRAEVFKGKDTPHQPTGPGDDSPPAP